MEELAAGFIDPFVGVGAKEIALSLKEVGRKICAPVSVEERESRSEARKRHAHLDPLGDHFSPTRDASGDLIDKEWVYQQTCKLWIFVESLFNLP